MPEPARKPPATGHPAAPGRDGRLPAPARGRDSSAGRCDDAVIERLPALARGRDTLRRGGPGATRPARRFARMDAPPRDAARPGGPGPETRAVPMARGAGVRRRPPHGRPGLPQTAAAR